MSKKLAIKRVGPIIPTVCLIAFLFIVTVVVWLATAGLPRCVIDKIENAALDAGVPVKIEKITLNIFRRSILKAEKIEVYANKGDAEPLLQLRKAEAGLSVQKLIIGKVELKSADLRDGYIKLPISDTDEKQLLEVSDINLSSTIRNNRISLRSSNLKLQGIPISLKGTLNLNELNLEESAEEEQEKLIIPAIIKTCQSIIDRVYHQIEDQHWTPEEYPEMSLQIAAGSTLNIKVQATAPKYDINTFSFRDTKLDINYEGDRCIINTLEFKTISPAAHVQLKGGYEIDNRKLSVTLQSDAALLDMAKALATGETLEWLNKFSHSAENAPHINLSVKAEFDEDFGLNQATIDGEISQKELHIGSSCIDNILLSFYYSNGNFNVDNLLLEFPDGRVQFTAQSNNGNGQANLEAKLPILRTICLVNEFLETPLVIPMGLKYGEHVTLSASAALTMPIFAPGNTYADHFVPSLRNLSANIGFERLEFLGYKLNAPSLSVSCNSEKDSTTSLLRFLKEATVTLSAKQFRMEKEEQPKVDVEDALVTLNVQDLERAVDEPRYTAAEAELNVTAKAIDYDGAKACNVNLSAHTAQCGIADAHPYTKQAEIVLTTDNLEIDEVSSSGISLSAAVQLSEEAQQRIEKAELETRIYEVKLAETGLGEIAATISLPNADTGNLNVSFVPLGNTGMEPASLTATSDMSQAGKLRLNDIKANLPVAEFAPLLEALGLKVDFVELPKNIELSGNLTLDSTRKQIENLECDVKIPHIVRTPQKLKVFQGERIPLGVSAGIKADFSAEAGIEYQANVEVTHKTGTLKTQVSGNTDSHVHATGTNTIRADVVDRILDLQDAHEILRDFNFRDKSRSIFNNILVDVRYDNGIDVGVDCDITLHNAQYQLSAIIEDENGNEKFDPQLGSMHFVDTVRADAHLRVTWQEDIIKDGKTLPAVTEVVLTNAAIDYNNVPWLKMQDFTALGLSKNGPGVTKHKTSLLKGDKIVIDIENDAVRLTNINGTIYPAYSLGMFYTELRDFMSILVTPYPAKVSTLSCNFPISKTSKEPMTGNISVSCPNLTGLDFLGTTIPMTKFTGFVNLTEGYVTLDRMNALCWNGSLDAVVKIGISGERTSFDGQVQARNMDLKKIAASYGVQLDSALCEADFRFRSPSSDVEDIQGYGNARISNGNLLSLSIFQPIGAFVSDVTGNIKELDESAKQHKTANVLSRLSRGTGATINAIGSGLDKTAQNIPGYNHIFAYDLQNANVQYVLDKGHFKTRTFEATGYNLKVTGLLDINLDTMEIYGNMWPQVSSLPTILLSPLTFLSDFMLDIVLYGKIDDIQWSFKLDKRVGGDAPVTATAKKDTACPAQPKKKAAKSKAKKN